ncbi:GTPase and tRNA-U34 5-formylation enzyme TrmE [Caenispirillum salinarum AK4]|uniref:tRNA modification GTPase MnmE n=1 Tax=Caenispirillum salinarum AK4 TaxID=1238182 RepID=K9HPJ3_9PROT|nr:tRNA uridine-5-carboxymethylaminomethyl(34) synthesis GTPase MnmE [Caenispirillum salinarum]EKV32168.1 GTPase and tRNA-U34 5-formylation enzyme TrmE [Caenispirillum salinarum AK4]
MTPTIFAPATAPGRAGVAIVRISGPLADAALSALTAGAPLPQPRRAARVRVSGEGGEQVDDGLALRFPAPASFTGEDVVELHLHGSRAVMEAVMALLSAQEGLRVAEPGEFTRRAFENGKMDLTQAEALADLIDAETAAQRRQALRQMDGALARLYDAWRDRLVRALAHLEAFIDFPDEELPPAAERAIWGSVEGLTAEMRSHLDDGHRGERLRDGLHIAIIGPPNAGKSSLLNALAQREAAIVSDIAGTTRDVVDVHLDLGGYPVVLADTAGLREAAETIESEGIRRARARAEQADLRLAVFDGAEWPAVDDHTLSLVDDSALVVVNKADLGAVPEAPAVNGQPALPLSVKTGRGLDTLLERLTALVADRLSGGSAAPALTRARHRAALAECVDALARAQAADLAELAAEDLRLAVRALGRITGRVEVDELLDVIFRDFCIGK